MKKPLVILTALLIAVSGVAAQQDAQQQRTPDLPLKYKIMKLLGQDVDVATPQQSVESVKVGDISFGGTLFDITGGGDRINTGDPLQYEVKITWIESSADVCYTNLYLTTDNTMGWSTYTPNGDFSVNGEVIYDSVKSISNECDGSTHTYFVDFEAPSSTGDYTVWAYTGDDPSWSSSDYANQQDSDTMTVQEELSPIRAEISGDNSVTVGRSGSYSASGSTGEGSLSYTWYVDGSRVGSGKTMSTVFNSKGSHRVTVEIQDEEGRTDKASMEVNVEYNKPEPKISMRKPSGDLEVGDKIVLDASQTSSGSYPIQGYNWRVGGTLKTGQIINHRFQSAGQKTIKLEVIDSQGSRVTTSKTVQVAKNYAKPNVVLRSPKSAGVGEEVTFSAAGTQAEAGVKKIQWTIAGQRYTGKTATVQFDQAGTYTVKLAVTDKDGQTTRKSTSITIQEGGGVVPDAGGGNPLQGLIDWITGLFTK